MDSIGIRAIAYALPDTTVDLTTLAGLGLLESPASTLAEFGFCRVHVSDRPAHDLALDAVQRLLAQERLDPESIDAIFFAGAIPSSHHVSSGEAALAGFTYPAARIQYECGLMNATALGISQTGCTGLMTAVALAADHLRANSEANRIVCVSGDVLPRESVREIIFNVISDGACALLVERGAARHRLLAQARITKGYYWNAGASRNEIVASYFPTARTLVRDTLAGIGLEAADVAAVIPHNVSLRSWQILLPMLGIPMNRLFAENIARKGHVIAADNFINLKDAADSGRVRSGDRLLLFNFGFGANWACMVLEA
jgi:3-oxoacyl-[acyl-carrier-protein] synthase III